MNNAENSILKVPQFLQNHAELTRRGITLEGPIKPFVVYETSWRNAPHIVVKILSPESQEADISERLQADIRSPNHAIPSEVIPSEPPLLLMPCLSPLNCVGLRTKPLSFVLYFFSQIVEGLQHLHLQQIVHLDVCVNNLVVAVNNSMTLDRRVELGKIYFIDFQTSQQLQLPPGIQPAITLPQSQVRPPPNIKQFDPYSWDVYCLGYLLRNRLKFHCLSKPKWPWIACRYIDWLIGTERGCTVACHCRPTALRAHQVLTVIRWAVHVCDVLGKIVTLRKTLLAPRIVSI
ncbi:hypothetical protein BD311DRAFT_849966 [Dichomitus squalens]|uniref:Protein kinase domain-containing protein n=1 Tax=Dichomitus squalens TaxID=114155 RepID=A0A4Q9MFQ6_9APHY|nr:hypothetical protein BD311DRAFT_849966 [Dichomitus squalens]